MVIARTFLKRSNILIFDEATSALDGGTAENFAKTINALRGRVAMLFITHPLPKILQVDEVVHIGDRNLSVVVNQDARPSAVQEPADDASATSSERGLHAGL